MIQSVNLKISGKVNLKVVDKNGNIKSEKTVNNLIVNSGLQFIIDKFLNKQSTSAQVMSFMAIGTGETPVSAGDTTLTNQVETRQSVTTTDANRQITFTATFPATNDGNSRLIREAGIFTSSTGGIMFCKTVFGVVTKTEEDALAITWIITVGAGT